MTQSPSITLFLLSLSPPPLHPFLFSTVWTLPLKSVQMQWEERPEVQPYSPATPQGRTEQGALLTITNANPGAGPVGPNCQSPPSPVRLAQATDVLGTPRRKSAYVPRHWEAGRESPTPTLLCSVSSTPSPAHRNLHCRSPDPHLGLCVGGQAHFPPFLLRWSSLHVRRLTKLL